MNPADRPACDPAATAPPQTVRVPDVTATVIPYEELEGSPEVRRTFKIRAEHWEGFKNGVIGTAFAMPPQWAHMVVVDFLPMEPDGLDPAFRVVQMIYQPTEL